SNIENQENEWLSPNFSSIEKNKAALRGIKVVSPTVTPREKSGLMGTECIIEQVEFQQLGRRAVIGRFDGGKISSDAGGVLLREVERRTQILRRLAGCFWDYRDE